jgi:hypothetical protein
MCTGACHGKGTSHVLAKISGVSFALLLADAIKWSDRIHHSGFNLYKKKFIMHQCHKYQITKSMPSYY